MVVATHERTKLQDTPWVLVGPGKTDCTLHSAFNGWALCFLPFLKVSCLVVSRATINTFQWDQVSPLTFVTGQTHESLQEVGTTLPFAVLGILLFYFIFDCFWVMAYNFSPQCVGISWSPGCPVTSGELQRWVRHNHFLLVDNIGGEWAASQPRIMHSYVWFQTFICLEKSCPTLCDP